MAFSPDEQKRFTVLAAAVLGKPAASEAARSLYVALPSETCDARREQGRCLLSVLAQVWDDE